MAQTDSAQLAATLKNRSPETSFARQTAADQLSTFAQDNPLPPPVLAQAADSLGDELPVRHSCLGAIYQRAGKDKLPKDVLLKVAKDMDSIDRTSSAAQNQLDELCRETGQAILLQAATIQKDDVAVAVSKAKSESGITGGTLSFTKTYADDTLERLQPKEQAKPVQGAAKEAAAQRRRNKI